jgi:hypothetical protein
MSPELTSKIAGWRSKALQNQLSVEEMREAILALRADRVGASIASAKTRVSKAKAEIPDALDLLAEMGGAGGN